MALSSECLTFSPTPAITYLGKETVDGSSAVENASNNTSTEDAPKRPLVFHSRIIAIVPLMDKALYEVTDTTLKDEGATEVTELGADVNRSIRDFDYIISDTIFFPQYEEAKKHMIPVVKPGWALDSSRAGKFAPIRPYSPDPKFIFSDVTITCSGIPTGDREAIYGGVYALGGNYTDNLTRFTTHIVALSMDENKCQQAKGKPSIKIVLPHWVEDCLTLRRRLDESDYELPFPAILSPNQHKHNDGSDTSPTNKKYDYSFISASRERPIPKGAPTQVEPKSAIFKDKTFYISKEIHLSTRCATTIQRLIEDAEGTVVESNLHDAAIFIGNTRSTTEYIEACKANKVVGNITWLYWMLTYDKWSSPLDKLLHYPLPPMGMPEARNMVIALTGFVGDARTYLERLIKAFGAQYTRTLKPNNTHLIAASADGEKYHAAREWNINIVNFLWLEESYAYWAIKTISMPQYTKLSTMTQQYPIIGQTPLYPESLKPFYENVPRNLQGAALAPSPTTLYQQENYKLIEESFLNNSTPTCETPSRQRGRLVNTPATETPKNGLDSVKPLRERNASEFNTPIPAGILIGNSNSSSGRRAKEKAVMKLHDDISDLNEFQRQRKSRDIPALPSEKKNKIRREGDIASDHGASPSGGGVHANKKMKATNISMSGSKIEIRVMQTGSRIHEHSKASELKLEKLGIGYTSIPEEATHVVCAKILRTEKFLCALARGSIFVKPEWIEKVLESNEIVPTDEYLLIDHEGEDRFGISLIESLNRARELKGQLFDGITVNVTPKCKGGFQVLRHIVEANGGEFVEVKQVRAKEYVPCRSGQIILISNSEESNYCEWFFKQTSKDESFIFSPEWILASAMRMRVKFDDEFSLLDDNE